MKKKLSLALVAAFMAVISAAHADVHQEFKAPVINSIVAGRDVNTGIGSGSTTVVHPEETKSSPVVKKNFTISGASGTITTTTVIPEKPRERGSDSLLWWMAICAVAIIAFLGGKRMMAKQEKGAEGDKKQDGVTPSASPTPPGGGGSEIIDADYTVVNEDRHYQKALPDSRHGQHAVTGSQPGTLPLDPGPNGPVNFNLRSYLRST